MVITEGEFEVHVEKTAELKPECRVFEDVRIFKWEEKDLDFFIEKLGDIIAINAGGVAIQIPIEAFHHALRDLTKKEIKEMEITNGNI